MKAATVSELKKELAHLPKEKLIELCTRMARFKKENKELLNYLLFEDNENDYILRVNQEINTEFNQIPVTNNLYLAKKSIRKILRVANKHIRYTGSKKAEIEVLIYFSTQLKNSPIPVHLSIALTNILLSQIKKVNKLLPKLHEDLQYDYKKQLDALSYV